MTKFALAPAVALVAAVTTGIALSGPVRPAAAQSAEAFYGNVQDIHLIISAGPGGGYSVYGRNLARHMPDHLPGHPNFIVQNMPGGGGVKATNYLYTVAKKDGSVLGLIHSSVSLAPLYGIKGARFDATKFNWLGSMNKASGICVAWHTSPIKTWNDMLTKTFVVGSTGAGSQMSTLPAMLNALFGTRIKIITGYRGGNDVYLAMERGEVQGRCGGLKSSIRSTRPEWFPKHLIGVPIQIARTRDPDFANVPTVWELAKDDRTRAILKLVFVPIEMDRPVLAPPGVPADRVALLRKAFDATMKDPKYLAEAHKQHLETDSFGAAQLASLVKEAYGMPSDVIKAAADAMTPKSSFMSRKAGAKGGKRHKKKN